MAENKEKKRLTLTANKMPDVVYEKLEALGSTRRLTPYIVGLMQKEEMMDELISGLSSLITKIDVLEKTVYNLNQKLDGTELKVVQSEQNEPDPEVIEQGELNISEEVIGGIEEEIEDMDF